MEFLLSQLLSSLPLWINGYDHLGGGGAAVGVCRMPWERQHLRAGGERRASEEDWEGRVREEEDQKDSWQEQVKYNTT